LTVRAAKRLFAEGIDHVDLKTEDDNSTESACIAGSVSGRRRRARLLAADRSARHLAYQEDERGHADPVRRLALNRR